MNNLVISVGFQWVGVFGKWPTKMGERETNDSDEPSATELN